MSFLSLLAAALLALPTFQFGTAVSPKGESVYVDSKGLLINGEHKLPVMGEIHFTRVPEAEWKREVLKMKAGGIDIIATYIFWIHHEPVEGQFDWSGNHNLRRFIEICKECGMMVVLRVGPFCHGEVYLGGMPEWIVNKSLADPENYELRTSAPGFIDAVASLYNEIGKQAEGLLWKDGGPVVGVQVDNESPGPWPYLATLKEKIIAAGMDVPFYTRTGWPKMIGPAAFGEILPMYGDYADGFWDRELEDMPGAYRLGFWFKQTRLSAVIATETFGRNQSTVMDAGELSYPYLTCELGGGMMPSYHRRIHIYDKDALALVICKLGAGSNLPGYYMYHGGTNPYCAEHSMAETQNSPVTNWNDMPHMSYDFQAPLGEMGQPNKSYHYLRLVHQMLRDWGTELAEMDCQMLVNPQDSVRKAIRSNAGEGFVFVNNYERMRDMGTRPFSFFGHTYQVKDGEAFCFPFGMKFRRLNIEYASAQPFCKLRRKLYFVAVDGIEPELKINGKVYKPQLDKPLRVGGVRIVVMSPEKALTAYKVSERRVVFYDGLVYRDGRKLVREKWQDNLGVKSGTLSYYDEKNRVVRVDISKVAEAGDPREVKIGALGVAEQPYDDAFEAAAVWSIDVNSERDLSDVFLKVSYRGDVARVYADGILVEDNFWNGREMLVRCSELAGKKVELRILPLSKDAPIYLQKEQREILDAFEGDAMLSLDEVSFYTRS